MNGPTHTVSVTRTLRLKVKPEARAWLNAAATEVNTVWNWTNETSVKAARPFAAKAKWLSGFDLNNLSAGATEYFEKIGADTIQRVNGEYALKRRTAKRCRLRWRVRRLQGVKWREGCFAQDAVGDWWLCLPVLVRVEQTVAPYERVGIDLGLKDVAVTSDGDRCEADRFYRGIEQRIAQAQRRAHQRQAKRLHRRAANRRRDALHKFSRRMVDRYQNIVVGDVSSTRLTQTWMAKSVLDSGWGMLRQMLRHKGEHAGRSVTVACEKDTSRACSCCGSLAGPRGVNGLRVRRWTCVDCGESHDRDVNAARNLLRRAEVSASVRGNESSSLPVPPSRAPRSREAGPTAARVAA